MSINHFPCLKSLHVQLDLRTRCIFELSTIRQNRTTFMKSLQGRNCAWLRGALRNLSHVGTLQAGCSSFLIKSGHSVCHLRCFPKMSGKHLVFYLLTWCSWASPSVLVCRRCCVLVLCELAKKGSVGWGELQLGDTCS